MARRSGRHFLQIPGPTNVPDRVLRAIDAPTIDHRGPDFAALGHEVLEGLGADLPDQRPRRRLPVVGHRARGRRRWSTRSRPATACSPSRPATSRRCGARWPSGSVSRSTGCRATGATAPTPRSSDERLAADRGPRDPGRDPSCTTRPRPASRAASPRSATAIDAAGHPALLLVDTISSLGSIDYRHDDWGVDVTVGCSQKGLMLPAGLGFNAVSDKALAAAESARLPRSYWDWAPIIEANRGRLLALHARPTNLLYGLREAIAMLLRGGPAGRLRAPPPPRRGHAPRGARLGPRGPLRGRARALAPR